MARRSKSEAKETREHIVEASIKLFLHDGVSNTTLEKIAVEAGCTRGAVYHHFSNKAELLLELVKRARPPAQEMFDSLDLDESRDPLGTLAEKIGETLERMLADKVCRAIHTIFIYNCEFIEKTNPVFEPERKYGRAGRKKICDYLERARKLDQLRPDANVDEASLAVIAFCFGLISLALRNMWFGAEKIDPRKALKFFMDGFRADASCHNASIQ